MVKRVHKSTAARRAGEDMDGNDTGGCRSGSLAKPGGLVREGSKCLTVEQPAHHPSGGRRISSGENPSESPETVLFGSLEVTNYYRTAVLYCTCVSMNDGCNAHRDLSRTTLKNINALYIYFSEAESSAAVQLDLPTQVVPLIKFLGSQFKVLRPLTGLYIATIPAATGGG